MIKKQAPSNKQVLNSSFQLSDRFPKQRVLVVSPIVKPEIGGPATYVEGLIGQSELLESKFEFEVVAFGERSSKYRAEGKAGCFKLVGTGGGTGARQWRLMREIWRNSGGADLIYALDPLTVGVAATLVGKLRRIPVVIRFAGDVGWEVAVSRGELDVGLDDYLKTRRRRPDWRYRLQKWVLAGARVVVVPGKYLRGLVIRFYGVSSDRVRVIRNAVELSGSELRIRNYKLGGRSQIVAVGRLVRWKNFDVLIKAFARLLSVNQGDKGGVGSSKGILRFTRGKRGSLRMTRWLRGLRLVIVGEGPERGRLESLVKEWGLEDQAEFLGRLSKEKTAEVVKRSGCLVLPSSYEGMSHVLLEAMAWGCPVVASDIEANREVVIDGKTGLLFELGSGEDLARCVAKLAGDEKLRKRLAKCAKRDVEKYNWERQAEKLEQLFGRIKNREL